MLRHQLTLYHHVVYIDFDALTHLQLKHLGHHPLVGGPDVLQAKSITL